MLIARGPGKDIRQIGSNGRLDMSRLLALSPKNYKTSQHYTRRSHTCVLVSATAPQPGLDHLPTTPVTEEIEAQLERLLEQEHGIQPPLGKLRDGANGTEYELRCPFPMKTTTHPCNINQSNRLMDDVMAVIRKATCTIYSWDLQGFNRNDPEAVYQLGRDEHGVFLCPKWCAIIQSNSRSNPASQTGTMERSRACDMSCTTCLRCSQPRHDVHS